MKRRMVIAVVGIGLAGSALQAGVLRSGEVTPSAAWVLHIDVESLLKSRFGDMIRAQIEADDVRAKLAWAKQAFGLDPVQDIADVTVYGDDYEHGKGVMILRGRFDEASLTTFLALNATYGKTPYGNTVIHEWLDDKPQQKRAASFAGGDKLVLGGNVAEVQAALDVLEGRKPGMDGGLAPAGAEGSFFSVGAKSVNGSIGNGSHAKVLENAQRLSVLAGESGGNAQVRVVLGANTEELALQMEQLVSGMRAFMLLGSEQEPEKAALANAIAVSREGVDVIMQMEYPADKLAELMRSAHGAHGALGE